MPATYSYNKKEKLKSRKALEQLFTKGKSFSVFPVKVFYMPMEEVMDHDVKVGVGVSARNFKKATDRNRIKRLLRECYRLNKLSLNAIVGTKQIQIAVFFLYIGKELPEYILLTEKMQAALKRLEENIAR
jgi:ribonuclease P protein component